MISEIGVKLPLKSEKVKNVQKKRKTKHIKKLRPEYKNRHSRAYYTSIITTRIRYEVVCSSHKQIIKTDNSVEKVEGGFALRSPSLDPRQQVYRVHGRRDFFLHEKLISGKRESVSYYCCIIATFDENRLVVSLCATKNEGTYRGGEGTTPLTTVCPGEDR